MTAHRTRPAPAVSRAVTRFSRLVLGGYFRAVEVQGRPSLPSGGPILVVANHANGLLDPLLVIHAVERLPRFLAKAVLWKPAPLRPVLGGLGMLPVVRRQDRVRTQASNADTFAAAQRALADGSMVAIFPEGTAHDEPHLLPLRTGAARLALGARAEGATNLRIVPVGLVFDDKLALRSRALAVIGPAIELDAWVSARGEPTVDDADRPAVEDLTARLARALTDVVPTADSVEEAWALATAADVVARQRDRVPLADLDAPRLSASALIRRQLAAAPETARAAVKQAADRYGRALTLAGLRDHDLVSAEGSGRLVLRAVLAAGRSIVLAPWALFGAVVNAVPYGAVRGVGRIARKPAAAGTVRVLVGVVVFPAAWVLAGVVAARRRSRWVGVAVGALGAACGYAAVVEFERLAALRRSWEGRRRRLGLRHRVEDLLAARQQLVASAEAALDRQSESLLDESAR
jgi:1-acyl-sn-glycerol-3-phosphate acyltransferase